MAVSVAAISRDGGHTAPAGRVPVTTGTATSVAPASTVGTVSGRLEDLPAPTPSPTRVRVAAAGIDAPVTPVGVDGDSALVVPEDVAVAGWYRFGPSPGEPGSSVVTAHVDSARQGRGAFFPLREVEPGAVVTVTFADGANRDFTVTARRSYPKATLPVTELFDRSGPPRLTLVTCGGAFDRTTRSYEENLVVYAVPA